MNPINIEEPVDFELILVRSTAATTRQLTTWRGVDGEGEHIVRFNEVGHEPTSEDEIDEAEDVHSENQSKNNVEHALPWLRAPRRIILSLKSCIKCLILWLCQCWHCSGIIPCFCDRG